MSRHRHRIAALALVIALLVIGTSAMATRPQSLSLEGTWTMTSAYEILADGTRTTTYGEHPNGLLIIDRRGRYSLQIFRPDRPRFAAAVKARGTTEEFREAVIGSSTHFGRVEVDAVHGKLIFRIEAASFPNWEGAEQVRDYVFKDGTLSYAVPASAAGNGTVAHSIWQRVQP